MTFLRISAWGYQSTHCFLNKTFDREQIPSQSCSYPANVSVADRLGRGFLPWGRAYFVLPCRYDYILCGVPRPRQRTVVLAALPVESLLHVQRPQSVCARSHTGPDSLSLSRGYRRFLKHPNRKNKNSSTDAVCVFCTQSSGDRPFMMIPSDSIVADTHTKNDLTG